MKREKGQTRLLVSVKEMWKYTNRSKQGQLNSRLMLQCVHKWINSLRNSKSKSLQKQSIQQVIRCAKRLWNPSRTRQQCVKDLKCRKDRRSRKHRTSRHSWCSKKRRLVINARWINLQGKIELERKSKKNYRGNLTSKHNMNLRYNAWREKNLNSSCAWRTQSF